LLFATFIPITGFSIVKNTKNLSYSLPTGLADSKRFDLKNQNQNIAYIDIKETIFYGYNAYDPSGVLKEGTVYFKPADPGTITQIAPTMSSDFISGGTWTNNNIWYGCEYGIYGNRNIWIIDNETGFMTRLGSYYPPALSLNGLAYNPKTDTMYGCSDNALYTINMTTGSSTFIGYFDLISPSYMIAIAFDDSGNLYGNEIITDSLYKINPSTGGASLIGVLGIDINYAQDMAFDNDTKTLYLSAYTLSPYQEAALYTCNTTTGHATRIGTFQGNAQITGFAIPLEIDEAPPEDTIPPKTIHQLSPAIPDGTNGWYINDVTIKITSKDAESGVAWTKYSLNNGASWTTHSDSTSFDVIIGNGEYQVFYYSADNAGNEEPIKGPFSVNIDGQKPQKGFYTFPIIFGPVLFALLNFGIAKDSISGLEKIEFQLNDVFHHQRDVSWWPTGILYPFIWPHIGPGPNDNCSVIIVDKAGNFI
jgi:hypothetical protein